jgi:hypothetical protein
VPGGFFILFSPLTHHKCISGTNPCGTKQNQAVIAQLTTNKEVTIEFKLKRAGFAAALSTRAEAHTRTPVS